MIDPVALLIQRKDRILINIHVQQQESCGVWLHIDPDYDLCLAQLSHFIRVLFRLLDEQPFYISAPVEECSRAGIVQVSL